MGEIDQCQHQQQRKNHGTTGNTMTLKDSYLGSLLGLPVECSKWIVVDKTQNNNQTYKDQGFQGIQTSCLGDSARGTEPHSTQ